MGSLWLRPEGIAKHVAAVTGSFAEHKTFEIVLAHVVAPTS